MFLSLPAQQFLNCGMNCCIVSRLYASHCSFPKPSDNVHQFLELLESYFPFMGHKYLIQAVPLLPIGVCCLESALEKNLHGYLGRKT